MRDTDCDFRLIRKSALDRFELKSTSGTICVELVKKLQDTGARFAEVPVHHYHRVYGRSPVLQLPAALAHGRAIAGLWWKLVVQRARSRRRAGARSGAQDAGK